MAGIKHRIAPPIDVCASIRLGGSCIIFTNSTKYLKDADELDTPRSTNELKEFKQACGKYAKKFGYILAV